MGWGQPHASAASTPGKDPVPIVQEAGWAPGPVWTGAENLVPTGIRSRTVQPVVSRYTDYANRPTLRNLYRPQHKRYFRVDRIKRNDVDGMSFGGSERQETGVIFC